MKSRKTAWIAIVALVILAATFVWNRQHYREKGEIVVGAVFDLTGSLSYMGQWSLEGAKLAEKDINAAGGIKGKKLRLMVDDAETNPQKATTVFQRLVSVERFPIVIGFNASGEVMAAAPIANREHVVLFSSGGASPTITDAGDYVFRNRLSGAVEASAMADIAYQQLGFRRGMILNISTEYGEGYAEAFRIRFSGLGGEIVSKQSFTQDQTDLKSQIQKIREQQNLDFVYVASFAREGARLFKQAKELGVSPRWLASNAIEAPELFTIAGDAANGILFTVEAYDPHSVESSSFNDAYRAAYGRDSEMFAAHAYDAVRIAAKLIEEAGNNGEAIKNALYEVKDYPGASGKTSFDKNGDVVKAVALKETRDGKFSVIAPEKLTSERK